MTSESEALDIDTQILNDKALIANLTVDEATILVDWARAELQVPAPPSAAARELRAARVRAIMKEIDDLVGNRQTLVADDLEERMIALLVGDLDPKSQTNLEISRDVAQVTAEKDHLEGAELVRRLTIIAAKTRRLITGTLPPAGTLETSALAATSPATVATELRTPPALARARPIPRPAKIEPRKPALLQRLFGRK
jgi:hypothetical protein